MARKTKKHSMQMTPVMSLAVFALFAMMIPVLTIANSDDQASTSSAQVITPSPSPEAMDDDGMLMEN